MRKNNDQPRISPSVDAEVTALEQMGLSALREAWRVRWGPPPRHRSADLLRLTMAWRIQAGVAGGLGARTKAKLTSRSMPRAPTPEPGTRLTREYRGVLYTVEVEENGVRYAGCTYGSLSEVARAITGTHWNGPRFFGLRTGGAS